VPFSLAYRIFQENTSIVMVRFTLGLINIGSKKIFCHPHCDTSHYDPGCCWIACLSL